MTIENLDSILVSVQLILWLCAFLAYSITRRAVEGSYERYVAASWWLTIAAIGSMVGLVLLAVIIIQGDGIRVSLQLIMQLLWALELYRASRNDNWFNNQRKKAKTHLERIRSRLSNALPRLSPLPTPA